MDNGGQDLLIIGAGPAGLAAAVMARRAGLDPLVLEKAHSGGTLRTARWVENYPGFPQGVEGWHLAEQIVHQADTFQVRAVRAVVSRIERLPGGGFALDTGTSQLQAKAVIAAWGARWRALGILGEAEAMGSRVFNTMADYTEVAGQNIAKRDILVIGGGDVALDQAMALADRGARVTLAVRSGRLAAAEHLVHQIERARVSVRLNCVAESFDLAANALRVACSEEGQVREDAYHAVLVCAGREPDTSLLPAAAGDPLQADAWGRTRLPGLYVAGDLRRGPDRHTAIAVGDGQAAALDAIRYIRGESI